MNKKTVKKLRKQLRKATRPIVVEAALFPPAPIECFSYAERMFHRRTLDGQEEFYTTYPNQDDCELCRGKHEALREYWKNVENAFMFGVLPLANSPDDTSTAMESTVESATPTPLRWDVVHHASETRPKS